MKKSQAIERGTPMRVRIEVLEVIGSVYRIRLVDEGRDIRVSRFSFSGARRNMEKGWSGSVMLTASALEGMR